MKSIELLKRKQEELGLSDEKFARLLDVSFGHWNRVKKGREPGRQFLIRALKAFPELKEAILEDFLESAGIELPELVGEPGREK